MAKIIAYPSVTPAVDDCLVGTQKSTGSNKTNPTKNFTVKSVVDSVLSVLPKHADNTAALAAGLSAGQPYQTSGSGASPLNVAGIVMIVQ